MIGDLYDDFWQALPASCRGSRPSSLDEMTERLRSDLAPGDCVLFKGSHSTGIHRLIGAFAPPSSQPGRGS